MIVRYILRLNKSVRGVGCYLLNDIGRTSPITLSSAQLTSRTYPLFSDHRSTTTATTLKSSPSSSLDPDNVDDYNTMKRGQQQNHHDKPHPLTTPKTRRSMIPRKAAVKLTDKARTLFQKLLENPPRPEIIGIMLNYNQSNTGEPRMVFSFDFVTQDDLNTNLDEGVSLEENKSPQDSLQDGLPKLYVNHNAFLKVLGATVDIDTETITPILYDREGNHMDPNA